jgi:hypothetical protein
MVANLDSTADIVWAGAIPLLEELKSSRLEKGNEYAFAVFASGQFPRG